jgi:hypothetical protein
MKAPHVVMCALDQILPAMLQGFVADQRWSFVTLHKPEAIMTHLHPNQPTVVLMQVDPLAESEVYWKTLCRLGLEWPDVPVVIVSDAKLHDDDRPAFAASILDLGAKHIVFPPFTKLLLEDLAGGLMHAVIERQTGTLPEPITPPTTDTIDLAEGGYEEDE